MSGSDGISRLRKAVDNQASLGEAVFTLPVGEMLAMLDEAEDELSRLSWAEGVPAPVDADGEVVPLTTRVMYDDDGKEFTVNHIRLVGYDAKARLMWRAREITGAVVNLGALHLHRPDSWKRLEEDIRNAENSDACGYYGIGTEPCNEGCPGYKDLETSCAVIAMKDVLRRAKALAERDAKASTPQSSPHEAKGDE